MSSTTRSPIVQTTTPGPSGIREENCVASQALDWDNSSLFGLAITKITLWPRKNVSTIVLYSTQLQYIG